MVAAATARATVYSKSFAGPIARCEREEWNTVNTCVSPTVFAVCPTMSAVGPRFRQQGNSTGGDASCTLGTCGRHMKTYEDTEDKSKGGSRDVTEVLLADGASASAVQSCLMRFAALAAFVTESH